LDPLIIIIIVVVVLVVVMLLVGVEKDDVEDELIAYISRHFWFANNNIGIILFMMPTII
jgi:hypothetical protein